MVENLKKEKDVLVLFHQEKCEKTHVQSEFQG